MIGHLANNSEEKGTVDLLQAAQILWEQGLDFQLVLAGPQMPNFSRFWQGYRFMERVRCLGRISDGQKRDFLAAIDAFCLPSRSDSFGLVLLEAWVHGLPNVVYRAGGIADLVRHDHDGLLAPCGDAQALAALLSRIVLDAELRARLGRRQVPLGSRANSAGRISSKRSGHGLRGSCQFPFTVPRVCPFLFACVNSTNRTSQEFWPWMMIGIVKLPSILNWLPGTGLQGIGGRLPSPNFACPCHL